jgi:hypothetical protein
MTFQPGHHLSNGRPQGSANRRSEQLRIRLKDRGDVDPADYCSSIVSNEKEPTELRLAASNYLLPYLYPKRGAVPTPRYVEESIDIPQFTHLSDAESFLAKIAALVANGQLDIQTGLELTSIAKAWLDALYAREELAIKQINAGTTEHEQRIVISGGLDQLPGTETILPQVIDGRIVQPIMINGQLVHPETRQPITNGHALAAPTDAVPQIESSVMLANDSALPQSNDSVQSNGSGSTGANAPPETQDRGPA